MSLLINRFYRFGDFTLDTEQRVLLRDGKPLALRLTLPLPRTEK